MVRFTLLGVALLIVVGASDARGQEPAEVKRLEKEIELLKRELKAAREENDLLKKEVERLKAIAAVPAAKGGLQPGSEWVGTIKYDDPGLGTTEFRLVVTKRDGKTVTAERRQPAQSLAFRVEGTLQPDGSFKFTHRQLLEKPKEKADAPPYVDDITNNAHFELTFRDGELVGTYTKPKKAPPGGVAPPPVKAKIALKLDKKG